MRPYPRFPAQWIHRCQTPIARMPGVFKPVAVQPMQLRSSPGVSTTLNLENT